MWSPWALLTGHIVLSVGLAFTFTPLFTSSMSSVPPKFYSHASAILGSVQQVAGYMAEISAASAEQSNGIALVNQAVTRMDNATQANAALVEQSASAARDMQDQAERLAQLVDSFKLVAGAPGRGLLVGKS